MSDRACLLDLIVRNVPNWCAIDTSVRTATGSIIRAACLKRTKQFQTKSPAADDVVRS